MYYCIFFIILLLSYFEIHNHKVNKNFFYITYSILTLMIVLRNGQGSDYYNYKYIYDETVSISQNGVLFLFLYKDPGYLFINYLAYSLGISYEWFAALFSLLTMMVFYPFFSKTCYKSQIPLLFFYSTCFLIYPFSGVRQGFSLAVLVSILYPLLRKKKHLKYYIIASLVSLIHQSILFCFLLPLIYNLRIKTKQLLPVFILLSLLMFSDFNLFQFLPIFGGGVDRINDYVTEGTSIKYFAKIVRVIVILPIFLISERAYRNNKQLYGIRNLLFFGFASYALLSFSELTSSRLAAYCRIFEGLFVYLLLFQTSLHKINVQLFAYFTFLCSVLFVKDIGGFIQQGQYVNCNIITYPYFTVFDDSNTILHYRTFFGKGDPDL